MNENICSVCHFYKPYETNDELGKCKIFDMEVKSTMRCTSFKAKNGKRSKDGDDK